MSDRKLLEVRNLEAGYQMDSPVRAVRKVSFDLAHGEFLGIAGESGCGKSTLAFAITNMLADPGKVFSGEVLFQGKNLVTCEREELRQMRWKEFSIVFQASMNALNPVMKIKDQIYDAVKYHSSEYVSRFDQRVRELFDYVNISHAYLNAYPHQLSGGMKQRVVIAAALALDPKLVIMDEPTTALDVVVQRKILQKVAELREKMGFSVIFITHDLSLLVEISDYLAIMYAGRIVEKAPSKTLFSRPLHPYTEQLMASFPPLVGEKRRLMGIPGQPPDLSQEITGCAFFERCPKRISGLCDVIEPQLTLQKDDHIVACHLYDQNPGPGDAHAVPKTEHTN
ncbi:MAG TPA: ABC transporter ATP-binding protein [Spirochaetia bacterium]|nr:ABC transporter ATP-binding protein [Spirochaetia bacterium]